jgi:hypothetical protein
MRRIAALLTAGVAIVLIASTSAGAQSHHKAPDGCPPSGRHTVIAADAQAEVYGVRKNSETIEYRGCVYGHTRWFDVGGRSECIGGGGCGGTRNVTLAGPIVARESGFVGTVRGSEWIVVVEDLRHGKVLHKVPTGMSQTGNPKVVGAGLTSAIVVKSDGAVAWINEHLVAAGTEYEVHALDKSGEHLLASGTDIGRRSLALAGSTLYWTQGGKPHSATLN